MITLAEASKNHRGDDVRSATIEMFAMQSDILAALPFETINGGVVKYEQEGVLPGIAFRGVNEAYTASAGAVNPQQDATFIVGGDLDVDKYLVETRGSDFRPGRVKMKLKALADAWAQKLIKGDSSSEPREFDGLQVRLTGNQVISNGATSGGDPLSVKKLDEAIDAVESPTHIIMSKAHRRNLKAFMRTSAMISEVEDAFGRKLTAYGNLPILTTNNGATEALPFTESATGGAATASSIYVVSLGTQMLQGIQNGDMNARDLGEIHEKPVLRLRVEWYAGIALFHGRAAARLRDISNATAVA